MNARNETLTGTLEQLTSSVYGDYLAVSVPESCLESDLQKLRGLLGEKDFARFTRNRQARDGDDYHVTVVTPPELAVLPAADWRRCLGQLLCFQWVGLGKAEQGENCTFYSIIESGQAQAVRQQLGLGNKDFHVTLGFQFQDVYEVAKDKSTQVD